jgi:hypothetical protein
MTRTAYTSRIWDAVVREHKWTILRGGLDPRHHENIPNRQVF